MLLKSGIRQSTNVARGELKRKRTSTCHQARHTDHYPTSQESHRGFGMLCPDNNGAAGICGRVMDSFKPKNLSIDPFLLFPAFHISSWATFAQRGHFWFGSQLDTLGDLALNDLGKLDNLDESEVLEQLRHIWQQTCPTFPERGHLWWQWSGTVIWIGWFRF